MDESLVKDIQDNECGLTLSDPDTILKYDSDNKTFENSCKKSSTISDCRILNSLVPSDIHESGVESNNLSKNQRNEVVKESGNEILNVPNDEEVSDVNTQLSIAFVKKISLDVVKDIIDSAQNSLDEILCKTFDKNEVISIDKNIDKLPSECLTDGQKDNASENNDKNFIENSTSETIISKCSVTGNDIEAENQLKYIKNVSKEVETEKKEINGEESIFYDKDTLCGFGNFHPKWMQNWATAKVYLILYSILGVLHGSYYSYLIGTISTLEKRFAFKSKISGSIMIADEVCPLLLGIVVGYYAGKGHRPRIVALGMFLSAGCCFMSGLPYFVYGSEQHLSISRIKNESAPEYCATNLKDESCVLEEKFQTLPAVLFLVFGSFLKGFGNIAYYAIGLAYLDDNSEKKDTPIFLAVALALRLLGPLLGFLMSSGFLKLYENPLEDPGFGPEDPRWVGAWWMGFVVQGILLLIFTIPIALFPKKLPSSKKLEEKVPQEYKETWREMISGLLSALKRMAKNPIFIFKTINTIMIIFGHFGYAIMLPKYMENQFRISASDASLFSGATSIACIMVSTIFGGFLIWKFKPNAKLLLAGMVASEIVLFLGYIMLMIPHCEEIEMLHFGKNDNGLILNSVCNQNCSCSTTSFTPFCGSDGKTMYFSPCFAGCTEQLESHENRSWIKEFGHCKCVATDFEGASTKITEGFCVDENCWAQAVAYICLMLISVTMNNILTVAHTMILLRSIHPSDKSVALGTYETFACLFGFIPFPITFGALVDSACLVWEENCGDVGNCWFYDMNKYNYLLHGGASIFSALSVVCLITLYCFSSRVRNLYKDDGEAESNQLRIRLDTVSECITKL